MIRTARADDLTVLGDLVAGERGAGERCAGARGAGDLGLTGDLAGKETGTGAGLLVRADRRGGGKLEGGGSVTSTGEASRLRFGVGSVIDGAGVGRVLVAAGEDLGAALGVVFVEERR